MRIGVLPLARPTFDTRFAQTKLVGMLAALGRCGIETLGPRSPLMDDQAVFDAIETIEADCPQAWAVLQTTFTDASAVSNLAERTKLPILIWAVREHRTGGRLRLNSFCGLNLASHALGLRQRPIQWLLAEPEQISADQILSLLNTAPPVGPVPVPAAEDAEGRSVTRSLRGARIGRIGPHPPGFDTCAYDPDDLRRLCGIEVLKLDLEELFAAAGRAEAESVGASAPVELDGLDALDPAALHLSCRLIPALKALADEARLDAASLRCWPECFTEYGGAVCGPVSVLADEMFPCACESDVYGAVTQLALQRAARGPVFLSDLVDADYDDDTAVVWHCGQAPLSMRDPDYKPEATVHSNRRLPLLCQFPLKPGTVTLARISKARGRHKLALTAATMLRRPLAFSGTAGVLKFERPAHAVIADIINTGLEHHFAIAYGDFRRQMSGVAAALGIDVLEL